MSFPKPAVDIHGPPEEFDALIDWFELVSYNLVLLQEYARSDIRSALEKVTHSIEVHLGSGLPQLGPEQLSQNRLRELREIVRADHEWFRTSLEQLWWFFGVVEREDHGGHRQALGQYGRVLAESLRRHRRDEREFLREVARERPGKATGVPPSNSN